MGDGGFFVGDTTYGGLPFSIDYLGQCVGDLGPRPQVWVHESAAEELVFESSPFFEDRGHYRLRRFPPRDWSCTYWYVEGGAGFDLHIPDLRRGSPFAGTAGALELAREVATFHRVTGGAPWRGAGSTTSDAWLRARAVRSTLPPPLLEGKVHEAQQVWGRAPRDSERHYRFCHALDLNGAFLAVAGSIELPTGEPAHIDWPVFDKRIPGVWCVESPAGELVWVTTPTMERLDRAGQHALEGWLWADHGRHLRRWQETLRAARLHLLEEGRWRSPAGEAVRQVYQQGLGRLASRMRAADPPTLDPLYQPYTNLAVIAESRCRLMKRLEGTDPIAIYRDAVFYLSSRTTPAKLAGALRLPISDTQLGAFKPAGTCTGGEARALMANPRGSMANTVKLLAGMVKR